ncbi:MAG: hypothetical protein L0I88_05965 [Alkalibacterium sp.]|nr:hypothetical protein [Alkalibacterium sp.]
MNKYSVWEAAFIKETNLAIWEIEFKAGDWEYEYEIKTYSKEILDFEKK